MVRVYDCFTFFNEWEALEIRVNELVDVVDRFVLVEATRTYQGNPKPLYYADARGRLKPFGDKIVHIVVEFPEEEVLRVMYPRVGVAWAREFFQRDMIKAGLKDCDPGDVVLISDVDEIPSKEKVVKYLAAPGIKIFEQRLFYYWLNCECVAGFGRRPYRWLGSAMLERRHLSTPQAVRNVVIRTSREFVSSRHWVRAGLAIYRKVRNLLGVRVDIVRDGGWHFSYLGGASRVAEKLGAFAHTELASGRVRDLKWISECISEGKDLYGRDLVFDWVALDESLPRYVVENTERFKDLIFWP